MKTCFIENVNNSRSNDFAIKNNFSFLIALGIGIILAAAAANRWFGEGFDYGNFYQDYMTKTRNLDLLNSRFEYGYQVLSWIFAIILERSFSEFYFSLAAIAISIKIYLFYKHLKMPEIAVAIYLLILFYLHEYTQIRAACGVSFAYLAIHFWMNRKIISSIILIIIAPLFHYSALIPVIVFFVSDAILLLPTIGIMLGVAVTLAVISRLSSYGLTALISDQFSLLNPVIIHYNYNVIFLTDEKIVSSTNLVMIITLIYSMISGIFDKSKYIARFTLLCGAGLILSILLISSPVISTRTRDVFLLATVFVACRDQLSIKTLPLVGLLLGLGVWQLQGAIAAGIIG